MLNHEVLAEVPSLNDEETQEEETFLTKKLFFYSCLQLEKNTRILVADFKEINSLDINDEFSQCVLSNIYKFFNRESPEHLNEMYFPAEASKINTRLSFQRLTQPLRKTNKDLSSALYIGPSLWKKLPLEINRLDSINSFKHG